MSRFVLGDELGSIKILRYSAHLAEGSNTHVKTVYAQEDPSARPKTLQKVATVVGPHKAPQYVLNIRHGPKLAAAFSDGSCSLSTLKDDDTLLQSFSWTETRITQNKFIGISVTESAVFTCTSNGMLRHVPFPLELESREQSPQSHCATLPCRLFDWRLSEDTYSFAYGGDEVDLSVWDAELAFTSTPPAKNPPTSRKRKRNDDLFPGEQWRARNVPNDHLSLRQPIRITALTFLRSNSNGHYIITGTQFGDLRRYDTRAARRPVSNWTGLGKTGGVRVIEKGPSEHEVFMGDNGSNLYSIDLRTGGILYGYKGFSGAVTSIAPSPTIMVSTSLDRCARVHTTASPPSQPLLNPDGRGKVLEKSYLTTVPTVVVWDKQAATTLTKAEQEDDNNDVWDNLENVV